MAGQLTLDPPIAKVKDLGKVDTMVSILGSCRTKEGIVLCWVYKLSSIFVYMYILAKGDKGSDCCL